MKITQKPEQMAYNVYDVPLRLCMYTESDLNSSSGDIVCDFSLPLTLSVNDFSVRKNIGYKCTLSCSLDCSASSSLDPHV